MLIGLPHFEAAQVEDHIEAKNASSCMHSSNLPLEAAPLDASTGA